MNKESARFRPLFVMAAVWCVLFAVLLAVVPAGWAKDDEYRLTILHTNDVHARILEFDKNGTTCDEKTAASGACFGGVARRATAIEKIRGEGGNCVLLDAGDAFQGTLFFTYYKGRAIQRFMNELGYQAMVVGNHEFDEGPAVLAEFIRGVKFPVLGANVDADRDPNLKGLIKPVTVLQVGGEKIGVLGFTTEALAELSKPGSDVTVRPVGEAIAAPLDELKRMGIDKIIALSHAGFERDKAIAAQVDGIDVIVGGHTHTLLSNTDPEAEGPYPVVARAPDGKPVLIVTDFAWGKYLGRLDVTFDADGVVQEWHGNPILLDSGVPEAPAVLNEATRLNQPLLALKNEIVGETEVDLAGDLVCRFAECNLGDLIADAMIWATAGQGTQIAMVNGGGIRVGIGKGKISRGKVLEALPFNNSISTLQLTGGDLLAALENGVSRAGTQKDEGTGRFLQVSGLRYTWDPQRPVGARVTKAEVRRPDGSYQPVDPRQTYQLAVNNFLRRGGDGYVVFAQKAIAPYDDGPLLSDMLVEYLKTHSPVATQNEGRITKAGGSK